MRQFTIAERLIAAGLLPLAALVIVHFSIGVLAPYLGLRTLPAMLKLRPGAS